MPHIRIGLDPGRMENPDLDIRYLLPDRLSALPNSTMKDNGYDYSGDDPPLLLIFVTSDAPDADVESSLEFLRNNRLLENDVLATATVCVSEDGDDWSQVYPPSLFDQDERFICDSVVYEEFAYRIDRERSSLKGVFDNESFRWCLRVACQDQEYPELDEDRLPLTCSPSLDLAMPPGIGPLTWRELEYCSYQFEFEDNVAFPLIPGIPSGAYVGYHQSCTAHQISFTSRLGRLLQLRWKPLARADQYDPGSFFYVDALVEFSGVEYLKGTSDVDLVHISEVVSKRFRLDELLLDESDGTCIRYVLDPRVEYTDESEV